MRVYLTDALKAAITNSGGSHREFALLFGKWKTNWPELEFKSEHFGKDGAYRRPTPDWPKAELRHAHLPPQADRIALVGWLRAHRLLSRKVSDRHLIYVKHPSRQEFLLIFILPEPDAHAVARMDSADHRRVMEGFARVATEFIASGKIII